MRISLHAALVTVLGAAVVVALVPAGLALDRRLAAELEARAREDLAVAPMVLKDRAAARADAMMMHAKEVAGADGLGEALERREWDRARELVRRAVVFPGEEPLLVARDGAVVVTGPSPDPELVGATREGAMPVRVIADGPALHTVALAPVFREGRWAGAAGVATAVGETTAATLAGLTRSQVVIVAPGGRVVAATGDSAFARAVADSAGPWAAREGDPGEVREIALGEEERYWAVAAPLDGVGAAVFGRSAAEEMAALPGLRRAAGVAGLVAVALALGVGALVAGVLARPVRGLARAADRVTAGEFDVPLRGSVIREVDRVSRAFREMRSALARRLGELREANRELEDRQERLAALQSELIQRDRLVASARLVAELAHEIRNPVANVRNCLEVVNRRVDDPEALEFTSMAIDELLRMHELSEQLLDLNRPADPDVDGCRPLEVAREAAALFRAGASEGGWEIAVEGDDARAAIGPDALKQVLINLVENAREAADGTGTVEIRVSAGDDAVRVDVVDDGPGIDEEILPRIFDPFFTTKGAVHGVGLGLFVAEGVVRRHGGRLVASNREEGGARFRIELRPGDSDPEEEGAGDVEGAAPGEGDRA